MPKATSLAREEIRRIHGVLRELFRKAGHGSIRRTERQLGLYQGYYRRSRHNGHLDLEVLFATLRTLAVEPADFFAEVYGMRSAAAAVERPQPLSAEARKVRDRLDELDDRRYEDAGAVLAELRLRVGKVPEELAAIKVGIEASCLRMLGDLPQARALLEDAARWAKGDALGDVHQRLVTVETDSGNPRAALDHALRAGEIYLRTGNGPRLGQSLVDQAKALWHLDEFEPAERALTMARSLVVGSDRRHIFAIEQYSMAIAGTAGDIERCERHAKAG